MFNSFGFHSPVAILVGFLLFIALFFVFRVLFLWYFKINRIVDLLEDIEYNTRPADDEDEQEDKDE